MHITCAQLRGHIACVVDIARLHITRQAINRVIGNLDSFFFGFVFQDRQNRSKHFFAGDGHIVRDIGENRWLDVVASVKAIRLARSAGDKLCAFIDSFFDKTLDFFELHFRNNWPDCGAVGQRIANFYLLGSRFGNFDNFVMARRRH